MIELPYINAVPFPILSALVLLPFFGAILVASAKRSRQAYFLALAIASIEFALTLYVLAKFEHHTMALQLVERIPLAFGLSYHLGVDGISVLFLPLTALLAPLVILYSMVAAKKEPEKFLAAILCLEGTLVGGFVSLDMVLFWLFASLELIPGAFLIRGWGTARGKRRREVALRYAAINLMGVLLLLAGMLVVVRGASVQSFSIDKLMSASIPAGSQYLAFWLFVLGFAIRIPLFPFHGWFPPVVAEGPVVGISVFLVGAKLGVYGLLRFVFPLLPIAALRYNDTLAIVGVLGMAYGGLLALVQTNLRHLVAFACLAHAGSVLVGLSTLNAEGLTGALLAAITIGFSAAGLYFVAGFLHVRFGTTTIEKSAGAGRLSQHAPLLSLTFLLIGLSTIGMPGTSGFEPIHLVVIGALDAKHGITAVAIGLCGLLGAAYLLRYFQQTFVASNPSLAPANVTPVRPNMRDLNTPELIIAATMTALIIGFGLYSHPLIDIVDSSVRGIANTIEHAKPVTSVTSAEENVH
jgi:NADH-quinone oxidoreductase subunit M